MRTLALLALLGGCTVDLDEGFVSGEELGDTSIEFDQNAKVCATGAKTPGIDVSYYQGAISWSKVAAAGYKFAFIRVSDGTASKDSKFTTNWAGAQAAGVIRGAYQYFRPGQNVTTQANMMIAAIGHYTPGDLPPVLDVEATDGLGPATVASKVNQWMTQVSSALGVKPIIYSGYYFWRDQVGNPATYASNPFWIAQYTSAACATIPSVWNKWAFWQHSASGKVNGISGNVDMDYFNGSVAELQAFVGTASTPDPDPTDPDPTTPTTPTGASCSSATLGHSVPSGTCVEHAGSGGGQSNGSWYICDDGAWDPIAAPTSACTSQYPL